MQKITILQRDGIYKINETIDLNFAIVFTLVIVHRTYFEKTEKQFAF